MTNGTSITGLAVSPVLTNVNVDTYPTLAGQVYSYNLGWNGTGMDVVMVHGAP